MRAVIFGCGAGLFVLGGIGMAFAQSSPPSNGANGPGTPLETPAPVPSVPPASGDAGGAAPAPPERIAPDRAGTQLDQAGPANATPLSGAPTELTPGTGHAAPLGTGNGPSTGTPSLSK